MRKFSISWIPVETHNRFSWYRAHGKSQSSWNTDNATPSCDVGMFCICDVNNATSSDDVSVFCICDVTLSSLVRLDSIRSSLDRLDSSLSSHPGWSFLVSCRPAKSDKRSLNSSISFRVDVSFNLVMKKGLKILIRSKNKNYETKRQGYLNIDYNCILIISRLF